MPRYLKRSTILVAGKKKEESEEQNAYIQYNCIKSKEFIIQETLQLPQMLLQDQELGQADGRLGSLKQL